MIMLDIQYKTWLLNAYVCVRWKPETHNLNAYIQKWNYHFILETYKLNVCVSILPQILKKYGIPKS